MITNVVLMWFILLVDIVLEEYNNCLPSNIWLCVKYILIVLCEHMLKVHYL